MLCLDQTSRKREREGRPFFRRPPPQKKRRLVLALMAARRCVLLLLRCLFFYAARFLSLLLLCPGVLPLHSFRLVKKKSSCAHPINLQLSSFATRDGRSLRDFFFFRKWGGGGCRGWQKKSAGRCKINSISQRRCVRDVFFIRRIVMGRIISRTL